MEILLKAVWWFFVRFIAHLSFQTRYFRKMGIKKQGDKPLPIFLNRSEYGKGYRFAGTENKPPAESRSFCLHPMQF
jgi:hypothetical protein